MRLARFPILAPEAPARHARLVRAWPNGMVPAMLVPALILAGCARYQPAPILPASRAAAFDRRSLADPGLAAFLAADGMPAQSRWSLARLTLAALYFHPDLAIARSQLAVAAADIKTAGAIPNPSLGFEELSVNTSHAAPTPWTLAPVINFLIETAGKRADRVQQAKALAAAARADIATAAWQVRRRVRAALLSLSLARSRENLAAQLQTLQAALAHSLTARIAAGFEPADTADSARLGQAEAGALREAAQAAGHEAEAALADSLGVPLAAVQTATIEPVSLTHLPAPPDGAGLAALRRLALTQSADLRASLARYAAAEAALKLEIARQYPDLTLSSGYIYDQGSNKYALYPGFELPIFNQNQGPIATALARRRLAAARFDALQQTRIAKIDGGRLAASDAASALDAARQVQAASRQALARQTRAFHAGTASRVMLLRARIAALSADLARLDAEAALGRALGRLEDALQQPILTPALPPMIAGTPA